MEFKLIYRTLRGVSDLALGNFFSEVHVEGAGTFPAKGPLLVVSPHPNEIMDMATLSATVPRRRMLLAWAKASMFVNPVTRHIMLSSGSIPVQRNPDVVISGAVRQNSLFEETSLALADGQIILIFPEGTSHTGHEIAGFREGAGWAAMEFAKWQEEHKKSSSTELCVVPVGLVYTDKSLYLSRVIVRYGAPIPVGPFYQDASDDASKRTAVKNLMTEVRKQIIQLTINAPDWDTLYSAQLARDMLWTQQPLRIRGFVPMSQLLIHILSPHETQVTSLEVAQQSLVAYLGLLHYTGTTHLTFSYVYPKMEKTPSYIKALSTCLLELATTLLHPRFILFIPALIPYIPGYIAGKWASDHLAPKGEEEARGQFKVIVGGAGLALGYSGAALGVLKWFSKIQSAPEGPLPLWGWITRLYSWINTAPSWAGENAGWTLKTKAKASGMGLAGNTTFSTARAIALLTRIGGMLRGDEGTWPKVLTYGAVIYVTGWILAKWHRRFIAGNYQQFKRLTTSYTMLRGLGSSPKGDLPLSSLEAYQRPPPPPINRFLKKTTSTPSSTGTSTPDELSRTIPPPPPVSSRRLVRHLFAARREATNALRVFLQDVGSRTEEGDGLCREGLDLFAPLLNQVDVSSGQKVIVTLPPTGANLVNALYKRGAKHGRVDMSPGGI